MRAGLASLSGEVNPSQAISELARETGTIAAQLAHSERLTERALYVACAAYVYSRAAAGGRVDEAKLAHEISESFERQLRLAGGEL